MKLILAAHCVGIILNFIYNSMYDLRHALLVPVTDLIYNQLRNIIVKARFKTDQLSPQKINKPVVVAPS